MSSWRHQMGIMKLLFVFQYVLCFFEFVELRSERQVLLKERISDVFTKADRGAIIFIEQIHPNSTNMALKIDRVKVNHEITQSSKIMFRYTIEDSIFGSRNVVKPKTYDTKKVNLCDESVKNNDAAVREFVLARFGIEGKCPIKPFGKAKDLVHQRRANMTLSLDDTTEAIVIHWRLDLPKVLRPLITEIWTG